MVAGRSLQVLTPSVESRLDFESIFLGDVFVRARGHQANDICQRRWGGVMRGEAEIRRTADAGSCSAAVCRRRKTATRKGGAAQEQGSQRDAFQNRPSGNRPSSFSRVRHAHLEVDWSDGRDVGNHSTRTRRQEGARTDRPEIVIKLGCRAGWKNRPCGPRCWHPDINELIRHSGQMAMRVNLG